VNAYEVKAGIGVIAGNMCDPCPSVLSVRYPGQVLQKEKAITTVPRNQPTKLTYLLTYYINTLTFTFTFK